MTGAEHYQAGERQLEFARESTSDPVKRASHIATAHAHFAAALAAVALDADLVEAADPQAAGDGS